MLRSLSYVIEALLLRSFEISSRRPETREASVPLHQSVCEYIAAGKATEAEAAMSTLLNSARADIDKVMKLDARKRNPGPAS